MEQYIMLLGIIVLLLYLYAISETNIEKFNNNKKKYIHLLHK